MAEHQNFRSAVNGFNRKDVFDFIDFLNNKHNAQLNQMRTEMDELRAELTLARQAPARSIKLESELAAAKSRCADLESELAAANQRCADLESASAAPTAATVPQLEQVEVETPVTASQVSEELAAYRRAERAERKANIRAMEICTQANGVLADATARVDDTAAQFAEMADAIAEKLGEFQNLMISTKATLRDAATSMYAIRPEEDDL